MRECNSVNAVPLNAIPLNKLIIKETEMRY